MSFVKIFPWPSMLVHILYQIANFVENTSEKILKKMAADH